MGVGQFAVAVGEGLACARAPRRAAPRQGCCGLGADDGNACRVLMRPPPRTRSTSSSGSRRCVGRRSGALDELDRARVGQRPQAPLADERLVDAAEPAAVGRVDRRPERDRLAVHRAARRDDEVGERDRGSGRRPRRRGRSAMAGRAHGTYVPLLRRCAAARPRARRGREPRCSSTCGNSAVGLAVVERDVWRRADDDEDALWVDARARRARRGSGSKSAR